MAEALLAEEELNERLEIQALNNLSDLKDSMAKCDELTNSITALNGEIKEKIGFLAKGQVGYSIS